MNGVSVEHDENLTTSHSGAWVVEMQSLLVDTDIPTETARWEKLSIYRVPEWIKSLTKKDNFVPHLVSLGPFHHGKPELLPMEEHKRRAALHMARRSGKELGEFVTAIEEVTDELQGCYLELDEKWRRGEDRGRFVEMMVIDGCFLLEMTRASRAQRGEVESDYADNDPIYSDDSFTYLWALVRTDMVLVENQLPLLVLQKLEAVHRGAHPSDIEINRLVLSLLKRGHHDEEGIGIHRLGLHPLDLYHKSFCGPEQIRNESATEEVAMPSAVELNKAGVIFKMSETNRVNDVHFKDGVLTMPKINVNNQMPKIFLNLMAFERLQPNCRKDVTTYVFFMDNVINSARDVALLRHRRNGIIVSFMSSDKRAAVLFSEMSKISRMDRNSKLAAVQEEVCKHCRKPWNKWRASFVQTHLSDPFVFISLVVAIIILIATLLQTFYTILSFYNGH